MISGYNRISHLGEPGSEFRAVTKSDTTDLALTAIPADGGLHKEPRYPKALYIGGAGAVAVLGVDDADAVTFAAVPVGTTLWIRVQKVMETNTTATNIVAIY